MSIKNLNILINDTAVAATNLNIERTEDSNPVLKYNGADDEYQAIMASELSFNMLVPDAIDGKFLHLFTGNETRFEVQLENADTEEIIWQGFLLPDIYSEPYENGCFFVQFTATDGIGRLKNKYLPNSFYTEIKTLPQIIGACLAETGLNFNTVIAPAITNAAKDLKVSDIEIDTTIYLEDDKEVDAYTILEGVLTTMGCKLFTYGARWYVIGINRTNDATLNVEVYNAAGVEIEGENTLIRNEIAVVFKDIPVITAVPPFKTVALDWDKDTTDLVLPEDIVYQLPLNYGYYSSVPRYWQKTGNTDFQYRLSSPSYVSPIDRLEYIFTEETPVSLETDPFVFSMYETVSLANIESNYVDLIAPVFVEGSYGVQQTLDVEINALFYVEEAYLDGVTDGDFARVLLYEVLLGDEILVSNKAVFDNEEAYDFELSAGKEINIAFIGTSIVKEISAKVTIKNIPINKNGYVNVKLHPLITTPGINEFASYLFFTDLNVTYNTSENEKGFTKKRNIDFTTLKDITVPFGGDRSDLTFNKLLINKDVSLGSYQYVIPAADVTVPVVDYLQYTFSRQGFDAETGDLTYVDVVETILFLSEASYNYLSKNKENVFIKRGVSGDFEVLTDFVLSFTELRGFVLSQYDAVNPFLLEDDLYVKVTEETITEVDDNYLRVAWKQYGTDENINYLDALAKVYHSTIKTTKFKIEGEVFGIYSPLDLLQFNYLKARNFNATNLTLNLSQGISSAVLVESVNQTITDYET